MPKLFHAAIEVPSGSRPLPLKEWMNNRCRGHGFKFLEVTDPNAPVEDGQPKITIEGDTSGISRVDE